MYLEMLQKSIDYIEDNLKAEITAKELSDMAGFYKAFVREFGYTPTEFLNMSKKRKHGSGTLRKRTDGRWEARVVIGYDEKGKPITKNVTANEKSKCLEKLEKLKNFKEKGIISEEEFEMAKQQMFGKNDEQ